ncbi:MAG: polyprenyl synthetase family protein [Acidobacteria bacterium]|nr:polyprenyl synthetase family protein [Acidobacteriota bacterium]
MPEIAAFLSKVKASVETRLDEIVPAAEVPPTRLHEAIRWSLFGGGKRVRPALAFATGKAFAASDDQLVSTAVAIELIHTYSLVHDDLPSMDDDDLRRGRATCHKKFDEATAILAGDVMQTLAFAAIAGDETLTADLRIRLIELISDAAGTPAGMVSGQQLDLDAEGAEITVSDLENIHRQKTGALISASAKAGAMIGRASGAELAAVEEYARAFGLLFQVTDDLLDVTQATETLGKTAGKDVAANKATYPALVGVDETRRLARTLTQTASEALSCLRRDTQLLTGLLNTVANRTS